MEVLTLAESRAVRQELEKRGELERILKPRWVLTDKNKALRTPTNPLPEKPNARLIVPGYKDIENLKGELRRDSPTGSRLAQYLLLAVGVGTPIGFFSEPMFGQLS